MSNGINKTTLIGNLGADPELRRTNSGDAVCTLSLATGERWKDRQTGEQKEHTEWHRLILWRRLAEIAEQYLRKGSRIYCEGKLRTRKWQDNSGMDRYTTEIIVNELRMLDARPENANGQPPASGQSTATTTRTGTQPPPPDFDDDVPF